MECKPVAEELFNPPPFDGVSGTSDGNDVSSLLIELLPVKPTKPTPTIALERHLVYPYLYQPIMLIPHLPV